MPPTGFLFADTSVVFNFFPFKWEAIAPLMSDASSSCFLGLSLCCLFSTFLTYNGFLQA